MALSLRHLAAAAAGDANGRHQPHKRGAFIKGGEVPNWFVPPDNNITKERCPTAVQLQQQPPVSLEEIGARIEAATAKVEALRASLQARRK